MADLCRAQDVLLDECFENSVKHGKNFNRMKSQSTIECLILRVNHAALEIVSAEELGLSFADHGRRFRSAVIH